LALAQIINQMPDANDMDLVQEFARRNSEAAFTELVQRYIPLVYSIALRYTRHADDAQDVTQAVFIILAQKAAVLRPKIILTGWLYETTRFTAMNFLTSKSRRQNREQEAYMQSTLPDSRAEWELLEPHLEVAMSRLGANDRTLLVLRFYENKSGPEAAALLGIREDTAHKRVARAIEKLRKFFAQQGVTLSCAAIAGAVSANSVQAAPVALVKTISVVAVAKGAAASTSITTLVKGTLKLVTYAKMKLAISITASILLACGAATLAISQTNKVDKGMTQIFKFQSKPTAKIVQLKSNGDIIAELRIPKGNMISISGDKINYDTDNAGEKLPKEM
jgi:RNA polymerase sigma factor (sigma-70 family)